MVMPKFAILISQNEYLWWKYLLVVNHKPQPNEELYPTPEAALKAALIVANRKGIYNV